MHICGGPDDLAFLAANAPGMLSYIRLFFERALCWLHARTVKTTHLTVQYVVTVNNDAIYVGKEGTTEVAARRLFRALLPKIKSAKVVRLVAQYTDVDHNKFDKLLMSEYGRLSHKHGAHNA